MARPIRMLAVTLSGVLVLTMGGLDAVVAHEFDAASTISLRRSKKNVKKKGRVVFSGQVNSPQADCLGGRQVTLVGRKVKSTTTGPDGSYRIRVRPGRPPGGWPWSPAPRAGSTPTATCAGETSRTR